MAQIIETIDVNVPVRTAYNQWTQFEDFPRLFSFVESVRQLDDTTLQWKVKIGGDLREFDARITEQHPDERVAWNSIGGDENHAGAVTFHQLSQDVTRVTVQIDWKPEGVKDKVGAVLGLDDRAIRMDLENFKEFIESRGSASGAWRGDIPK